MPTTNLKLLAAVAILWTAPAFAQTPTCPSGPPCQGGVLPGPLPLFPASNWWNLDISTAPVDPNSANFIAFINNGGNRRLHPDFGGEVDPGSAEVYGLPYVIVSGTQPKKIVTFLYADESDGVGVPFYPIPDQAITQPHWIEEGNPGNIDLRNNSDRHLLMIDQDNKLLYELYNVFYNGSSWQAGSGARFDLNTNNRRPEGFTSADASGMAILPGLVRYDEAYLNPDPIRHAIRVTVRATNNYVYPASHLTCQGASCPANALPMGARLRLKPGVTVASSDLGVQRIVQAMKTYGLIVADNGSDMYFTGTFDTRWDMGIMNTVFHALHANDFEVIQRGYAVATPPSITIDDAAGIEGSVPATRSFGVRLNMPASQSVTVSFATADGSASSASDYSAASGVVTFLPGQTTRTVTVNINGDLTQEPNETFYVNLSSPVGATIADGQGLGTIIDDDAPIANPATVYRLLHPSIGAYLFTIYPFERDSAQLQFGYVYEGPCCKWFIGAAGDGRMPLYRLFSSGAGEYFFTITASERDAAVSQYGYVYEGIAAYCHPASNPAAPNPWYRLRFGNKHLYTVYPSERDAAVSQFGYTYEGITCYLPPP